MAQYDEIVKHLMDRFSDEFAKLAFNTSNVEVVAKLDTEQQTVKVHQNDMTFKVRFQDEEVILHIEAQTHDSRDKPMPLRVLAYASVLMLRYEIPVYSMVLYLAPNAGRTDFQKHISEEMMQESPFYQLVIQRGIEQGAREVSIKNILSALTARFPQSDTQHVEQALEAIFSLDRLTELHLIAIQTPSFEAFLQVLEA